MSYNVIIAKMGFDGPLDLLLQLIDKAKIDIKDIFISDITEQYLSHIREMEKLDMDVTSEFLELAATLLEIKSRSMLPKPQPPEEGEEDPEQALIRRLTEYKAFKEAGKVLQDMSGRTEGMYFRLQEELSAASKAELTDVSLDSLASAFGRLLRRIQEEEAGEPVKEIERERVSVQLQLGFIREQLRKKRRVSFYELLRGRRDRDTIVTTFMAMLELWRLNNIRLEQDELFSDIILLPYEPVTKPTDEVQE